MKYQVFCRFWGYKDVNTFTAKNAIDRDRILKELEENYSITMIGYNKLLKDGSTIPVKTVYIGLK